MKKPRQSYGPLSWTMNLDAEGVQHGHLSLLHSDDEHAYGEIQIPLSILRNGKGPGVILSAGNHGNEYEGQIILRNLLKTLDPARLNGTLYIMPALNTPAVRADQRVSPLDQGNMNRSFPGAPDRGPTAAIAGFVTQELLPRVEFGVDFHSGDASSVFLPCAFLTSCADPQLHARTMAGVEAFAAPNTYVVQGGPWKSSFDSNAHAAGVAFFSTELGGGGRAMPQTLDVGARGLRRLLDHLGVYPNDSVGDSDSVSDSDSGSNSDSGPATGTRWLQGWQEAEPLATPCDGIFEPLVGLGAEVEAGQPAARVHTLWAPGEMQTLCFPRAGIVAVQRNQAAVKAGHYLYSVLAEVDRVTVEALALRLQDPRPLSGAE